MGCGSSASPRRGGVGLDPGDEHRKLLDEYSVGAVLGEGAFGRVSVCTKRSTGEEFAVKMIDKVENPLDAIQKEVEMLQSLNNPYIVKFHGVFYERCFVCIVMDKLDGGDMVEGLQRHLKEKGNIPCHQITHSSRQMALGIQHLHQHLIVHRDVKGDNYLMDRLDVVDPECRIILTDFGTAVHTKPYERLSESVGTRIFWSPEFCEKDYSLKVDVWAIGVIMYGLLTARFPFKDQTDIINKDVSIPKRVSPPCADLLKRMLEKTETNRPSADEVMQHRFIAAGEPAGHATVPGHAGEQGDDEDPSKAEGLRQENVNDGIKERRQVLLNRMNQEHEGKKKARSSQLHLRPVFQLSDEMIQGAKFTYEWWDRQKADSTGLLELEKAANIAQKTEASDLGMFTQTLEEHNIDHSVFGQGKAKTLAQLAAEVVSGACRLMLDATSHKKLVRVVDVVVFRLKSPEGSGGRKSRLLIETEECFSDGRKRDTVRLPGTKKEPHENAKTTAQRILQDMLDIPLQSIQFDLSSAVRYEEETDSPSYPGVRTVYRKAIVDASVKEGDEAVLKKIGLPAFSAWSVKGKDKDGNTKTFQWMTEETAQAKNVKLNAEGAEVVSTLVRAPIGRSEDQLREQLAAAGIDVSRYGKGGKSKTLKEFSVELVRGEATLVKCAGGGLQRIVDVVMLIIENPSTGEVLVQTAHEKKDGHKTTLNRLPGAKCRPDENQFLSARRILRRQLDMNENDASIVLEVHVVEEEKPTDFYPGLKTVYRKRLIRAQLAL
mmetsp:Transcript_73026/g.237457  ORF Transcript_73026/g.237457 Transcript_73026/m.237457 type:complete len:773 (-) Transcript_73026:133-2451(-)